MKSSYKGPCKKLKTFANIMNGNLRANDDTKKASRKEKNVAWACLCTV